MPIIKEKFPQWMEAFVNTLSKQEEQKKTVDIRKEAEINIKSLPKVVWNNTTFYVNLNEETESAEVLNEYGIPVTTIKNVASVDDVDHHLNDNQIVASKNTISNKRQAIFEEELRKATAYIKSEQFQKSAGEFDATQQFGDPVPNSNNQTPQAPQTPQTPQAPAAPAAPQPAASPNQLDTAVETVDGVSASKKISKNIIREKLLKKVNEKKLLLKKIAIKESIRKVCIEKINKLKMAKKAEGKNMTKRVNMEKKIDSLTKKVATLTKVIAELSDGLHAYTNPGNVYDTNAAEREVEHFNDTAKNSKRVIDIENGTDLTTPAGRTSLKRRILEELTATANFFDEPVEEVIVEEIPVEENPVEVEPVMDAPVEVVVNDVPLDVMSLDDTYLDSLSEEELVNLLDSIPEGEFVPVEVVEEDLPIPEEEVSLETVELPNEDVIIVEQDDAPDSNVEVKDKSDHDNAHGIDININDSENVDVNVLKHHDVDKKKKKLLEENEEQKEGSLKRLNKREAALLKRHVCPNCHKHNIVKDKRTKRVQGLVCKDCRTKFAVNLRTESIYKK